MHARHNIPKYRPRARGARKMLPKIGPFSNSGLATRHTTVTRYRLATTSARAASTSLFLTCKLVSDSFDAWGSCEVSSGSLPKIEEETYRSIELNVNIIQY